MNGIIDAQQRLHLPSFETVQKSAFKLESMYHQANEFVILQSTASNLQILKPPVLTRLQKQTDVLYAKAIIAHDGNIVQIINKYLCKEQLYYKNLNKFYEMAYWAQDDLNRWYKIHNYCEKHSKLNRIYKQECKKANIWF